VLGDWYATYLIVHRQHWVLCCAEKTFLPVVITARDTARLVPRLRDGLEHLFPQMGIPSALLATELQEMESVAIAKTASRVVLGVMNEYAWALQCRAPPTGSGPPAAPEELSLWLAETPVGPLAMKNPMEATRGALSPWDHPVNR
jgi:hypothetical protein